PQYIPFSRVGIREYRAEAMPSDGNASFSGVGFGSSRVGDGTWHFVAGRGSNGRMADWLIRNSEGNYAFAGTDYEQYTTQGAGSSATDSVIQVGSQSFTQH